MAVARKRLGKTKCPECGTEAWVKESESGSLSFTCPDCDYGVLLRKGTPAAEKMRKRFAPAELPKEPASPEPKPAGKPARPAFDMGAL